MKKDNINIKIENLGAVKKADVTLGDLTIIAGENSTGKTNLVYIINDILESPNEYLKENISIKDEIKKSLDNQETIGELDLIIEQRKLTDIKLVMKSQQKIKDRVHHVLTTKHPNIKINIESSNYNENIEILPNNEFYILGSREITTSVSHYYVRDEVYGGEYYSVSYSINFYLTKIQENNLDNGYFKYSLAWKLNDVEIIDEEVIGIDYDNIDYDHIYNEILEKFSSLDLDELFEDYDWEDIEESSVFTVIKNNNSTEIATSDRAGIISFLRDSQKKQSGLMREISLGLSSRNNKDFLYPLPIHNNINFISGIAEYINFNPGKKYNTEHSLSNINNPHLKHITDYIEDMIGGNLYVNQLGIVLFRPFSFKKEEPSLLFNSLSSSIKNLSMIVLQLKYSLEFKEDEGFVFDKKPFNKNSNKYYTIDEPEAFLHPANQTKMARVIAMLVNAGIKVIITTHSDYLIRELNALIALGSNYPQDEEELEGFSVFENMNKNMTLNSNKVKIYGLHTNGVLESFKVTETGLNLDTFDKAMNEQNKLFSAVNEIVYKSKHKGKNNA